MSREESPRLGLARTGELIAELGMRFRIAEHEAKRPRELLEDEAFEESVYRAHNSSISTDELAGRERGIRDYKNALLGKIRPTMPDETPKCPARGGNEISQRLIDATLAAHKATEGSQMRFGPGPESRADFLAESFEIAAANAGLRELLEDDELAEGVARLHEGHPTWGGSYTVRRQTIADYRAALLAKELEGRE